MWRSIAIVDKRAIVCPSWYSGGFRGGRAGSGPLCATHWRRHSRYSWYVRTVLYYGIYGDTTACLSLQTLETWYLEYSKWLPPVAFWQFRQHTPLPRPLNLPYLYLLLRGRGKGGRRKKWKEGRRGPGPHYANSWIRRDDRSYRCVVLIGFSFLKQRWLALSKFLVKRFVKISERPNLLIYGQNQRLGQWSPSTVHTDKSTLRCEEPQCRPRHEGGNGAP